MRKQKNLNKLFYFSIDEINEIFYNDLSEGHLYYLNFLKIAKNPITNKSSIEEILFFQEIRKYQQYIRRYHLLPEHSYENYLD